MARLLGPRADGRLVYALTGGNLVSAVGQTATIYTDAAATQLADIATYDGSQTPGASIPNSQVTVNADSQLPLFWYPDGVPTLYAKVGGGQAVAVEAVQTFIAQTIADAKGDLIVATTADQVGRLPVGTNGQALIADSSQSTGMKWGSAGASFRGAWAAATAYSVGDLVSLGGELLYCATAHISGSTFSLTNWSNLTGRPGQYNVKLYGAKGDGSTDDTAAINATIAAAFAAEVAAGTNYAEIVFPPATYLLSSATTKSASNKGNAQIWMPLVASTAQKFTMVLRGVQSATALPHWQQTNVQRSGAVLKTALTGQTVDGTWGPPSVVGGPTPSQGYGYAAGLFNNMLMVVDGISIVTPANPTMLGFDFSGMAEANVISASANASTTPGSGLPALCTNSWAYGVYMPQMLNNDLCNITDFSCEGFYSGLTLCEHSAVTSCRAIYCAVGITIVGSSSDTIWIGYASVEACPTVLQAAQINGGNHMNVVIDILDVEDTGTAPFAYVNTIDDASNILYGVINVHELGPGPVVGADPVVSGGANVKVVNLGRRSGNVAAPSVPASTVALKNPFYRDAVVVVTGGTVSAVAVDGVAQGYTATGFTVVVPTGKTITLTYSAAPSWKWTVL